MSYADRFALGYAGRTVAITGASGYLGSWLAGSLSNVACHMVLHSRRSEHANPSARVRWICGDVADPDVWRTIVGANVDCIFHLAAHEHRQGSLSDPILDNRVNLQAVLHLVEACARYRRPPRIVFASSANIVSKPESLPVDETSADSPLTVFAIHKLAAEKYLQHYARESGISSVSLRLTNVYGPLDLARHEISLRPSLNRMTWAAVQGGPIMLYGNRHCTRDYLFVDDAVGAFLAAGLAPDIADGSPYLIASGDGRSIESVGQGIADQVKARTRWCPEIRFDDARPLGAAEYRNFVGSAARFRAATGWEPAVDMEAGLSRTVSYFLAACQSC